MWGPDGNSVHKKQLDASRFFIISLLYGTFYRNVHLWIESTELAMYTRPPLRNFFSKAYKFSKLRGKIVIRKPSALYFVSKLQYV